MRLTDIKEYDSKINFSQNEFFGNLRNLETILLDTKKKRLKYISSPVRTWDPVPEKELNNLFKKIGAMSPTEHNIDWDNFEIVLKKKGDNLNYFYSQATNGKDMNFFGIAWSREENNINLTFFKIYNDDIEELTISDKEPEYVNDLFRTINTMGIMFVTDTENLNKEYSSIK